MNPKVDWYFEKAPRWHPELARLRTLVLDCNLCEELKWGVPCYTSQGRNIVLIHAFKEYCALLFFKGALMQDPNAILIQQTQNVQSARQIRFTDVEQVLEMEDAVKAYITEAIQIENSGQEVEFKKTPHFAVPDEFQKQLDEMPELQTAFDALTPGRQRAYLLHFSAPKQAKTRQSRVEKWTQPILAGKGLNDD